MLDTSTGTGSAPSRLTRHRASFLLLGAVQVILIAAITLITVALPAIQRDLQLDQAGLVFATAAYSLSFGGLLLLGGRLADLFGHRRVFIIGVALFALASATAGLSATLWALVAARFLQGTGAALAAPAAIALLGSVFPDATRRTRALATWGVLASLGASLGNILSGVILNWVSWRWLFLGPALLAAAVAAVAPRALPAGPVPVRVRIDLLGALLATAGLSTLIYGLSELELAWILTGAALLGGFAIAQARSPKPLVPLAFLASRERAAALLAICLMAAAMTAAYFILALYLQQIRDYTPLQTSAVFIPPALAILLAAPMAARVLRWVEPPVVTAGGLAIAALGLLLLTGLRDTTAYLGPILAGTLLFPLGAGIAFSCATVTAVSNTRPDQAGLAGAVMNTAMEIGPPLGLATLIPLATYSAATLHNSQPAAAIAQGYGTAFGAAAIALVLSAAITLTAGRTKE
ncbi:MAG TPA: MFS transporter [Micromonosporaceae bacterium]|nr:MFS transporter [Micromonosporaceae bacterium]